jgi:hypothetical protein
MRISTVLFPASCFLKEKQFASRSSWNADIRFLCILSGNDYSHQEGMVKNYVLVGIFVKREFHQFYLRAGRALDEQTDVIRVSGALMLLTTPGFRSPQKTKNALSIFV